MSLFDKLFGASQFLPGQEVSEAAALTNCAESADNESSEIEEKKNCSPSQKRKRCDSTDASDDSVSTVSSACGKKKCRDKVIRLKDEHLDLQCEWRDCDYRTCNLDHFVRHVSLHILHPEVIMNEDKKGVYACLWRSCGFISVDSNVLMRHINFHSYHTKLKSIGSNILARSRIPVCTFQDTRKNVVPDLLHAFECCWQTCEQTFNSPQAYFSHVETHVYSNPHGRKVGESILCHWRGCKSVVRSVTKLADHVRSHTKEKVVGCPTCGGLFANKAKFSDHCKRQISMELQECFCSHCSKYYPSKKLLWEHIRCHMNSYKCSFCDKTCSSPSSLRAHIRYRHQDSKPFKCISCEYRAKTPHDLKRHLNTHGSDPFYRCEEEGCDFSCRSAYGLRRHCDKCHLGCEKPQYCCHLCDSLFQRGSLLTHHLQTHHSIFRPSGHYRFRYKQDEDGFFRLLIVHPQRVQVTQMAMESQSGATQPLSDCSPTVSDVEDDSLTQEAGVLELD